MDQVAFWILMILGVALIRNQRAGTLGEWWNAKVFNAGAPAPADFLTGAVDTARDAVGSAGPVDPSSFDESTLVTVNGARLSPRFAKRWAPLVAAAKADGLDLTGGGYRSHAEQKRLYAQNCRNGRCNPPTAKPGSSRHETGDAIDVTGAGSRNTAAYSWLSRNAGRFGVYNLPSESWHWSIDGR